MLRLLTKREAEEFIIGLLRKKGRQSTRQIEAQALVKKMRCPDSTMRTLNSLRLDGKIKGSFVVKERAWLWWVEK